MFKKKQTESLKKGDANATTVGGIVFVFQRKACSDWDVLVDLQQSTIPTITMMTNPEVMILQRQISFRLLTVKDDINQAQIQKIIFLVLRTENSKTTGTQSQNELQNECQHLFQQWRRIIFVKWHRPIKWWTLHYYIIEGGQDSLVQDYLKELIINNIHGFAGDDSLNNNAVFEKEEYLSTATTISYWI